MIHHSWAPHILCIEMDYYKSYLYPLQLKKNWYWWVMTTFSISISCIVVIEARTKTPPIQSWFLEKYVENYKSPLPTIYDDLLYNSISFIMTFKRDKRRDLKKKIFHLWKLSFHANVFWETMRSYKLNALFFTTLLFN